MQSSFEGMIYLREILKGSLTGQVLGLLPNDYEFEFP
jgi:hypothetical protein